jgi:hypothetical protein
MENGNHDYYARRASVTYCNIYLNPKADNPRLHIDALFVFCDQDSLREFTEGVDSNELLDGVPFGLFILRRLLRQVIGDSARFLQEISREIHTAVRLLLVFGIFF